MAGWRALTVSDEGPGLGRRGRQAFERFWRGDVPRRLGLGLAIVRATAERHGGARYVDGARFTIELPALRDVSDSGGTPNAGAEEGSP